MFSNPFFLPDGHHFLYARISVERGGLGERGVYILDPVDVRIARTFRQDMDPTRTPREMAIAWAEEERKAVERDADDR